MLPLVIPIRLRESLPTPPRSFSARDWRSPRAQVSRAGAGWRALWADTVCLTVANADQLGGGQVTFAPDNGPLANVVIARGADGRALRILPVDRDPVTALLPRNLRDTEFNKPPSGSRRQRTPRRLRSWQLGCISVSAWTRFSRCWWFSALRPTRSISLDSLRDRPVWVEEAPELDGKPYGRFSRVITTAALLERLRLDPRPESQLGGISPPGCSTCWSAIGIEVLSIGSGAWRRIAAVRALGADRDSSGRSVSSGSGVERGGAQPVRTRPPGLWSEDAEGGAAGRSRI